MKPEWRRFAPIGKYLAIVAFIATIITLLIFREWGLPVQISLALTIIGLALYAILAPENVRAALTGRQARFGSNLLLLSLAVVGIVVVLNYFFYQNAKRWDLTEDKSFTLAQETLDTLNSLPEPVLAIGFFTNRTSPQQAREMLDQYKFYSNGKFDYKFIDPETDPVAAEEAKITRDGTVVLKAGNRQEAVTFVSEQELTGALVRLMAGEQKSVYFLTGHGEKSPDGSGEQALSYVKRTLESKNYAIKSLNLLADRQVPEDAKVVVIAGPRKPLSEDEIGYLSLYVSNGGALVVMEDPTLVTDFEDLPDPLAKYLTETWGLTLGNDFVLDTTSNPATVAVGGNWGDHQITTRLQGYVTVMFTARSVSLLEAAEGVSQAEIVSTSSRAWAETDLVALKEALGGGSSEGIKPDEGVDISGPVLLGAVAENFESNGRVVVFGDSDFASDGLFAQYGNGDLITNSIDWAAGQENLISLTPKDTTQRLLLPPQKVVLNVLFIGTVLVIPGLLLIVGVVVWIRRRRKG